MNALVLYGVGDLRAEAVPDPVPPPGWAVVRVHGCGICGSDLPRCLVKGTYRFPTVPGHEFAGVVETPGDGGPPAGTPVAVFPLIWCGRCEACAERAYARCADYDYAGSRRDGGWAEFCAVPPCNLLPLPPGVALDDAVLAEPAAVALHALRRGGAIRPDEAVAVFGAGPIGLMAAWWARRLGAGRVVLADAADAPLARAAAWGFRDLVDARAGDAAAAVEALVPGGVHLALEAAGVPATTEAALRAARSGGRVVLMGNPEGGVHLSADLISRLLRREAAVYGTWNSTFDPEAPTDDWRDVLRAMAEDGFRPSELVSHRLAPAEVPAFLRDWAARRVAPCRAVVDPRLPLPPEPHRP